MSCEPNIDRAVGVLDEVLKERWAQEKKWGQQNHPFLNGHTENDQSSSAWYWAHVLTQVTAKETVDAMAKQGTLDYAGIITEEYHEALEAKTPSEQREELIQLAACCVAAVESLDRNGR